MTTPPRWRSRRQALAPLAATLGAVARPNPLVWAWRWRYELILATAMSYGAIKLARILGAGWALGLIAALIAVAALWPPARHRLAPRGRRGLFPPPPGQAPRSTAHPPPAVRRAREPVVPPGNLRPGLRIRQVGSNRRVLGPGHPGDLQPPPRAPRDPGRDPPPRIHPAGRPGRQRAARRIRRPGWSTAPGQRGSPASRDRTAVLPRRPAPAPAA